MVTLEIINNYARTKLNVILLNNHYPETWIGVPFIQNQKYEVSKSSLCVVCTTYKDLTYKQGRKRPLDTPKRRREKERKVQGEI